MKEIKTGAVLSYLVIFCAIIVTIVITPIIIRVLGQEEYGLYALMIVLLGYLSILDMGMGNAIVRYISRNRAIGDKENEAKLNGFFLKLFIFIGLIILEIGLILYSQLDNIFGGSLSLEQLEKAKIMVLIITFSLGVQFPLYVFSSILEAYEKFVVLRLTGFMQVILQPLTILFFLYRGADAVTIIGIVAFYSIVGLLLEALFCIKILDIRFSFRYNNSSLLKEIFVYAFFIFIAVIADKIYWQTDQVLLGILKGTDDVAIYAIAIQFINVFMSLTMAISGLFLPRISILVTQSDWLLHINKLFIKVGSIQFFIVGYVLGGFFLFGKDFITLWVGEEFLLAYYIVLIIMMPLTVDLIQNLGLSVLKAKNLFKFRTILLISIAILNVVISIPAIKYFGLVGTASITAISLFVGNVIIMNIYYYKKLKLDIFGFWYTIIRMMIASSFAIVLMKLLLVVIEPSITWVALFQYIIFYSGVFGVSLFYIGINKNQRKIILSRVKEFASMMGKVKFWGQKQ